MCGALQHYQIMQKIKTVQFTGKLQLHDDNQNTSENIGKQGFCAFCGRELYGRQYKYCSRNCTRQHYFARHRVAK